MLALTSGLFYCWVFPSNSHIKS